MHTDPPPLGLVSYDLEEKKDEIREQWINRQGFPSFVYYCCIISVSDYFWSL